MSFQLMYQPLFVTPPPSPTSQIIALPDVCPRRRGSSIEPKMTAPSLATTPPLSPASSSQGDSGEFSRGSRPSSPCSSTAMNATIVAVDKDKNSPHAVRWAIENLASQDQPILLVHVKIKQSSYCAAEGFDDELRDLFTLYRGYSARKSVEMKEVVLEEREVVKGLLDYIANNYVANVVLGASSRNAQSRKLKSTDVSTSLMKSAPDFCSMFVISKGKVVSTRQARGVVNTDMPPRQPSPRGRSPVPNQAEPNNMSRMVSRRPRRKSMGSDMINPSGERTRVPAANLSVDAIDFHSRRNRDSISDCSEISGSVLSQGSTEIDDERDDFTSFGSDASLSQSSRELEAEMRRLKLELKQTMDMYSMACKEALTAKRKAEELHQMKQKEERRLEEARLAEETALAVAEMEKAKCKAAIDAAEKAQKLAEMEGLRRKHAEMKVLVLVLMMSLRS
ncbi:hypothetical protein MLD38_005915 [Melastoma candidum]|uniref:Uncharacterized protein n=1 Tax=Melastoma candidum TaxID=119954 RepID=A0ACB9RMF8_9MYRT|nr:hypothetical protein MLD38_005915 [Melastoma candidum]